MMAMGMEKTKKYKNVTWTAPVTKTMAVVIGFKNGDKRKTTPQVRRIRKHSREAQPRIWNLLLTKGEKKTTK